MKKIIFLILLFFLLATDAAGSPLGAEGPGTRPARADLSALHAGH